ncbi:MAG: helix-hairpin-helix domain-containing protein [Candidatus Riflebacteria bacterium]|nr:helix-hairpin-helix domain-containing protein [Candidatus Riflebacteria bacterium]
MLIPIVLGVLYSFFNDSYVSISELAIEEMKRMNFASNSGANVILKSLSLTKNGGEGVYINEAGFDELVKLPGVGSVTASLIMQEREIRKFNDWDDFTNRVRGMGATKVENLKSLGVRLNVE